jgi:hypothetical protein
MKYTLHVSIVLSLVLACTPGAGDDGGDSTEGGTESESGGAETESGEAETESGETETESGEAETGETETGTTDTEPEPASCAGSMAIICEDFETDDDFADWDLHVGGHTLSLGDVERDATHGRGEGALHTWADFQDNLTAWGWIERPIPTTHPDLFVRAYAYVPAASINEWFVLFALNEIDGYASLGLALEGDVLSTVGWGDTHQGVSDSEPFPTDQWVCLEFQLHYGDSNWFSAWRDGELVVDATPVTADQAVLDSIFFGLYGGNNEFGVVEFWIDDIVVDAAPVGCLDE